MFEVLESTRRVSEQSRAVQIDGDALASSVTAMTEKGIHIPPWDDSHHFFDGGEKTVAYFLALDSINFCFWPASGTELWEIDLGPGRISGYNALAAALKGAMESGVPLHRADYLAGLSRADLKAILGGRGDLQLMEERLGILREVGRVLLERYGGECHGPVAAARGSALELARLMAERFPSFRDIARFEGETVFFLKRAQIFAADLHGAFRGKDWGDFTDVDQLTAFADYKLPQVLRQMGILRYAEDLARRVDQGVILEPGGPDEVEIRANTVWAVELMRGELGRRGRVLKAYEIDWMLWNLGQDDRFRKRPYHRTPTIFY